jgi:integrase
MSMIAAAEQYLAFRRKLGFALHIEGEQLLRFARYAEKMGHKGPLTVELALRWAKLSNCSALNHARRLDIVRRFARYLKHSVPQTEVPPEGLLGCSYRRIPPHIYSEEEMSALMEACRRLTPANGLRPRTYETLFGLLVCTGMRISEALRLRTDDFDVAQGMITIVEGKFHKSRILPLHPSCVRALQSYMELREKRHPATKAFFVTERGTSLKYLKVLMTFRGIASSLGWPRNTRIHGLRHTFAVRRLLQWYRDGEDIRWRIGHLSTYLGHCKIADTYWYLSAVPELMALAASRFEQYTEVYHG